MTKKEITKARIKYSIGLATILFSLWSLASIIDTIQEDKDDFDKYNILYIIDDCFEKEDPDVATYEQIARDNPDDAVIKILEEVRRRNELNHEQSRSGNNESH